MELSHGSSRPGHTAVPVLGCDRVRQHVGDPSRGQGEVSPHGDQLLRHLVGVRRLPGRVGGDAVQRDLRGVGEPMAVHHGLVRRVALVGRPILNSLDPQSLRDQPGSLLGHHRPVHVSEQDEQETGRHTHCDRVDMLERHLVPGDRVVEGRTDGGGAGGQVPVHRAPGISHLLVDHQLLPTPVRHGVHLLQDLQGGRDPDQEPEAGHEASFDGLR